MNDILLLMFNNYNITLNIFIHLIYYRKLTNIMNNKYV
jgi:hypothetical protein